MTSLKPLAFMFVASLISLPINCMALDPAPADLPLDPAAVVDIKLDPAPSDVKLAPVLKLEPTPVDLKSETEASKAEIDQSIEQNKKIKLLAELTDDKELAKFSSNLELVLEASAKCMKDESAIKSSMCLYQALETMANEGNYLAQHALGNAYEEAGDNKLALEWYEKALANTELPDFYKPEIQADLERAKAKVS